MIEMIEMDSCGLAIARINKASLLQRQPLHLKTLNAQYQNMFDTILKMQGSKCQKQIRETETQIGMLSWSIYCLDARTSRALCIN